MSLTYATLAGDSSSGSSSTLAVGGSFLVFVGIGLAVTIAMIVAWVKVISREGYSGWWILIGWVPVLNVIMFLIFAFKESPRQRELRQLRAWAGAAGGYQGQPAPGAGR